MDVQKVLDKWRCEKAITSKKGENSIKAIGSAEGTGRLVGTSISVVVILLLALSPLLVGSAVGWQCLVVIRAI